MNILNKLTIKHLTMNKKRTMMSIIGILLSTALMIGIGLLCSSLREYAIDEIRMSGGTYHSIIEKVPVKQLDKLNSNSNVENYFYEYKIGTAYNKESNDDSYPYIYVNAVDEEFFIENKLVEGRFPKNENEIIIPRSIINQGNAPYKVGDEITLNLGKRYLDGEDVDNSESLSPNEKIKANITKTYKIVGVVEKIKYANYIPFGYNFYTLDNKSTDKNVKLYLVFTNPSNSVKISENIYKNLGLGEIPNIEYNNALLSMYGESGYSNITAFISSFLSILLAIVSVACAIVIYNSFAISVMERKKQFGLFSSIGATKKQLRKTVLFEAFVVGSIGIILGIISAYIGIGLVIVIINSLLKEILPLGFTLVTYPTFIIIPISFVIITVLVAAYLPARSASRISPIEVIRQNDDIKIKRKKLKTLKLLSRLFGVEGEIALKNMKRNKKKYRITIISIFISIVTFIAFSAYLTYGTETASDYMGNPNYDITIYYNNSVGDSTLKTINSILKNEQVDERFSFSGTFAEIESLGKDAYNDSYYKKRKAEYVDFDKISADGITINILGNKEYKLYKDLLGLKEDRPIVYNKMKWIDYANNSRKVEETEIFKNNAKLEFNICSFSNLYNSEKYQRFGFQGFSKDDIETYLNVHCYYKFNNMYLTNKVPSIVDGELSPRSIIISQDMYIEYVKALKEYEKRIGKFVNSEQWTSIYIKAEKYDQLDKLGKEFSNSSIYYNNLVESKKMQDNLLLVLRILLYGFIVMVTLIGVTSVFNTINTSINLRKREFSVLRSIGLTPHGFNKMIWYESIFFGLKALLYGIPVGILISYFIHNTMTNLVTSPFFVTIKPIIISIIGVFIIIILTMWYSTSKIKKENILDAIREENI